MNSLSEIVEYNKIHRVHKISHIAGLIELDDIDYSQKIVNDIGGALILPKGHKSIVPTSNIYYANRQEKYNEYCIQYFSVIYSILNNVPGVALFGGAALWLYNQSCIHRPNTISIITPKTIPKDFDLFIYEENDLSPEDLIQSQNQKINDIINIIINNNYGIDIILVKGVMTMQLHVKTIVDATNKMPINIQIILRDYCSISEILHSFDIPCCSIAYDGKKTYLTKLAEYSILYNINIIIPEYRSNTYETRLIKYFNNSNFALLLPNLKLSNGDKIINLPNMTLNISHTNNNIAIADVSIPKLEFLDILYKINSEHQVDYDTITTDYMIDLYTHTFLSRALQKNCNLIINGKKYFEKIRYFYKIQNFYDNFIQMPISEVVSMQSYKNWFTSHIKKNIIIYQDDYILNEFLIKDILKDNYDKFAEENNIEEIKLQLIILNEKILSRKKDKKIEQIYILSRLIRNLNKYIHSKYIERKDEILNFCIYLNRDEPLTGSLHPSKQTCSEWYGDHFIEPEHYDNDMTLLIKAFVDVHISGIEPTNCPLCFEQIHYLSKNVIILKCGHIYHENKDDVCEGINRWFAKNKQPSCPECRTKYPKKEIVF
jgi:hypothetical protein